MPGANGLYSFYVFFFFGEYFYDSLLGPLKFFLSIYFPKSMFASLYILLNLFACCLPDLLNM